MTPATEAKGAPADERPAADAEAEALRLRVRQAVAELSTEHRHLLFLKYVQGLSLPEMAKEMSASVPALKVRLGHARRELLMKVG
jgi:RNA polymerase sigma factor (sigma-70 family)